MSRNAKPDTSDEACAVVCMVVSNPGGVERAPGWQKRVNDLIRALRDERNAATAKLARADRQFAATTADFTRVCDERRAAEEQRDEARTELARLRHAINRMLPLKETP